MCFLHQLAISRGYWLSLIRFEGLLPCACRIGTMTWSYQRNWQGLAMHHSCSCRRLGIKLATYTPMWMQQEQGYFWQKHWHQIAWIFQKGVTTCEFITQHNHLQHLFHGHLDSILSVNGLSIQVVYCKRETHLVDEVGVILNTIQQRGSGTKLPRKTWTRNWKNLPNPKIALCFV
jgi:hypothetical protein